MKKKLIIISGPSGAGKTSIVKDIVDTQANLEFSISACSRSKRNSEKEGEDYYFLTPEKFKQRIKDNLFLEWEEVYKNQFYGTLKSEIARISNLGKNAIFDIDVIGALNIKSQFPSNTLSIFIMPPSLKILQERLSYRGSENLESLQKRLSKAKEEIIKSKEFDKIIVNNNLQEAIRQTRISIKIFLEK
ncbi:MAG: guanylate kinase [Bacteroidota bacterium]|nr:guanylate kinase [Bacteroidota bacterium]